MHQLRAARHSALFSSAVFLAACGNTVEPDSSELDGSSELGEDTSKKATPHDLDVSDPVAGWRWVNLPATTCMDGSNTGIGYQIPRDAEGFPLSENLIVYFQGGNACINRGCAAPYVKSQFAEAHWDAAICNLLKEGDGCRPDTDDAFPSRRWHDGAQLGPLDTNEGNPLAEWGKVYVPYCSGDWHVGLNPEPVQVGTSDRVFMGSENTEHVLAAVEQLFSDMALKKVLVTGTSAGGLGATLNFHRFADAFGRENTYLISDGGPGFPDIEECLQSHVKDLWRLDRSFPTTEGCPGDDCLWNTESWVGPRIEWLFDNYARGKARGKARGNEGTDPLQSGSRIALVTSDRDIYAAGVFGLAANGCENLDTLVHPNTLARFDEVEAGTHRLVDEVFDAYNDVKIFAVASTQHGWFWHERWWEQEFEITDTDPPVTITLRDWVLDMLNEKPWDHAWVARK
jgi:hypothetical protein